MTSSTQAVRASTLHAVSRGTGNTPDEHQLRLLDAATSAYEFWDRYGATSSDLTADKANVMRDAAADLQCSQD